MAAGTTKDCASPAKESREARSPPPAVLMEHDEKMAKKCRKEDLVKRTIESVEAPVGTEDPSTEG